MLPRDVLVWRRPEWLAQAKPTSDGGNSLLLSFIQEIDMCIDKTLSRLKDGYQIDAFLWHQGESDYAKSKDYYRNLKTMVAYVRMHLTEKTGRIILVCLLFLVLLPEVINISAEKWRMR